MSMSKLQKLVGLALLAALAYAGLAEAQGIPTARLTGRVTDADGNGIPGVTVEVSSPALQGVRTTQTDVNGDYIVPSLPAGDYTMRYTMDGFDVQTRTEKLSAAQGKQLDVDLSVAAVSETIEVTGEAVTDISQATTTSTTLSQDTLEQLPLPRTQIQAVALNAGTTATGPAGAVTISGAQSWESSYQINGVEVTDNLRRQPFTLFIEDAIEETTTSTAGISAEYGRFTGGLVNTVTKSGGNDFHGSLRDNLTNQDWNGTNEFSAPANDEIQEVYEGTVGGRIVTDKLWFFAAGRAFDTALTAQTNLLNLPYEATRDQQRYEGKLTFSPTANHRLTGSYIKIEDESITGHGGLLNYLVDLEALHSRSTPQDLMALNYSGVLTSNFFVEAQYSERKFEFAPEGGTDTSLLGGTPILDQTNVLFFNESIFCGACPDGGDVRENENVLAKATYFLSTERLGSHDIVGGYDTFNDIRTSNNYQSTTNFMFYADNGLYLNNIPYPVAQSASEGGASLVVYYPILSTSKGTDFKTNSLFINDRWRLNDNWSFNLGARYDANDGKDAEGKKVADDSEFSPRLGMTWAPNQNWTVNASYGRYVAAIANTIADASSAAGSPATYYWLYDGPSINTPGQPLLTSEQALDIVFNWFNSVGGINNTDFLALANIPGGSLVIGDGLKSTSADEMVVGFVRNFGSRGAIRADLVHREFGNFYATKRDLTTGQVLDPNGNEVDLGIIVNNDSVLSREYNALQSSFNFRATDRLTIGGNYTLSEAKGNFEGENQGSGPVTGLETSYPEYKDLSWNSPEGRLLIDQKHKAVAYAVWEVFKSERQRLALSGVQRYFSGSPYSAIGPVVSSAYVTDPGYSSPPASVNYFFSDRGAFETDDITQTDVGVNYSFYIGDFEIFAQLDTTNVFNEDGAIVVNQAVFTSANDESLQPFNPFTETPVEGVHWRKGANFGLPTSVNNLQLPRTYTLSLGLRF
jgi:outer membrane receptor protein involved in Fe transport